MELIWVSLIGAVLAIDTSLAFQFLVSQPLVACTILGWFLGDIQAGLHFGFLMQMIWLGNMPVGASSVPEGNLASMAGVPVYLNLMEAFPSHTHLTLILSIFYVLLLSAIGARLVTWIRLQSVRLLDWSVKLCSEGQTWGVSFITFLSIGINMILYAIFMIAGIVLGNIIGTVILKILPVSWDKIGIYTEMAIIGVGIGTVLPLYKGKRILYILLGGILAGIIIFYIM